MPQPKAGHLPAGYAVTDLDLDTLTRTLFGEARGEGEAGQIGVIHVVLNRLRQPGWWSRHPGDGVPDDTIAAACREPYQFSCWNPADPNRTKLTALSRSAAAYLRLRALVEAVVIDGVHPDPTGGATHYKVRGWPAAWTEGRTPTAGIGKHDFYRIGLTG